MWQVQRSQYSQEQNEGSSLLGSNLRILGQDELILLVPRDGVGYGTHLPWRMLNSECLPYDYSKTSTSSPSGKSPCAFRDTNSFWFLVVSFVWNFTQNIRHSGILQYYSLRFLPSFKIFSLNGRICCWGIAHQSLPVGLCYITYYLHETELVHACMFPLLQSKWES